MTELDRIEFAFLLGCAASYHCGREDRRETDELAAELKEARRASAYAEGYRDALARIARLEATDDTAGGDESEPDPAARMN